MRHGQAMQGSKGTGGYGRAVRDSVRLDEDGECIIFTDTVYGFTEIFGVQSHIAIYLNPKTHQYKISGLE